MFLLRKSSYGQRRLLFCLCFYVPFNIRQLCHIPSVRKCLGLHVTSLVLLSVQHFFHRTGSSLLLHHCD